MSPARRLLLQAVALVVGVVVIVAVLSRVLGDSRSDGPAAAQELLGPVLLVPGYGGSTTALQVLAADLRAAGREAVVVDVPGDGTGDLRASARALDAAAQAALAAGAPSVDVVGYSAGGVIARVWAAELDGDRVARRIVTLGSPHHGTRVAGLAATYAPGNCPDACRQLAPGSDLLDKLNDGDETPDGPRWVSVWTTQDETVTPPDTARLEGATSVVLQEVCPMAQVKHGDLPRSPLVQRLVAEALAAAPPPQSYGRDDCARLSS